MSKKSKIESEVENFILNDEDIESKENITTQTIEKSGYNEMSLMEVHLANGHAGISVCHQLMKLPPPGRENKLNCLTCDLADAKKRSLAGKSNTRASLPLYRMFYDSTGKLRPTYNGNCYGAIFD